MISASTFSSSSNQFSICRFHWISTVKWNDEEEDDDFVKEILCVELELGFDESESLNKNAGMRIQNFDVDGGRV